MLLTFSKLDTIGHPTEFQHKIIKGEKIHTIRKGNRWKPGMKIHFWMGSPRNKSVEPHEFKIPGDAAEFWNEERIPLCAAVEEITFVFPDTGHVLCRIGELQVDENILEVLAKADGFDIVEAFVDWFRKSAEADAKKSGDAVVKFSGQIIHWTTNVYDYDTAKVYQP